MGHLKHNAGGHLIKRPDGHLKMCLPPCPDATAACPNGCPSTMTAVYSGFTGICAPYNTTKLAYIVAGCGYRDLPGDGTTTIQCISTTGHWHLYYRGTDFDLGPGGWYSCPPTGTFVTPVYVLCGSYNVTVVLS